MICDSLRGAVTRVRARYPEDIFPTDGTSQDCRSAAFARLICDEILREAESDPDA